MHSHSHNGDPCHGHNHGGGFDQGLRIMNAHPNRQKVARIIFPIHCLVLFFTFFSVHSILFPTDFFTGISGELFAFDVLWALLLISFLRGAFTNPGYVSSDWLEKCPQAQQIVRTQPKFQTNPELKHMLRCPRSHRCVELKAEILRMDHFCVHYNNAVGLYNYKFFLLTMLYITIGGAYSLKLCVSYFFFDSLDNAQRGFSSGATVAFMFLLLLLYFLFGAYNLKLHIKLSSKNMTAIEHAKMSAQIQAASAMGVDLEMIHPWEYGLMENLKKMLGSDWWFWLLPLAPELEENGYDFPPNPIQSKRFTEQQTKFQTSMQNRRKQAMLLRHKGSIPGGDQIRVKVDKGNINADKADATIDEKIPLINE